MHNSFILHHYVCYVTILNMLRAVPCSFSGGTNCIITASGIVTLEIGERSYINKMRSAVLLKQY